MSRSVLHDWLLALCDPTGFGPLPRRLVPVDQFGDLLDLAWQHGVAGAVMANLTTLWNRHGHGRLFAGFRDERLAEIGHQLTEAKNRWLNFVAVSLFLRRRAVDVLGALYEQGMPVLLIKGEDFADRLYPQRGLRPFRDIDLLLPRETIPAIGDAMRSVEFFPAEEEGRKYDDDSYGEEAWDSHVGAACRVELHWNLINSPSQRRQTSVTFGDLQLELAEVNGREMIRPTAASMLIIATVHAVLGHRFDRLQHLCDIRQVCRGGAGEIDVDWLRWAAQRTGTRTSLVCGLEVTARLLDDPASREVLDRIGLPQRRLQWRTLVGKSTLLDPYTGWSKFRRQMLREVHKRAA